MRIVNIIPYFNEKEHLLLRIKTILDHIDLLIICEADRTHSGESKSFTLKQTLKELGLENHPKIKDVYINLPSKEENPDNWVRERLQRDTLALFCLPDDIVISTDCDEFFDKRYLDEIKQAVVDNMQSVVLLPMSMHFCRADLVGSDPSGNIITTNASFATTGQVMKIWTPSRIREAIAWNNNTNFDFVRPFSDSIGWHFSWMGSSEKRIDKLNAFAHSEDNIQNGIGNLRDKTAVDFISNYQPKVGSVDMLGRNDHIMKEYPVNQLPEEIFENEELMVFYLTS